jgi:hypothetical protein
MRKILLAMLCLIVMVITIPLKAKATYPVYTVSPNSATYHKLMMNFSTYNKYTKQYYLLRSYLERLEKTGGGTLILSKGTYMITNTLYVPSNVTIKFRDGVVIKKGLVTGTKQFSAAKSIFQLIRPSNSKKKGVYGAYNGEKNISFIGEGKVVIDMVYDKDSIAIIAGHNQNIKVQNIEFKNMYSGHFMEVDATKNINITNNQFIDSKASYGLFKEAINLDTPDRLTHGWSQEWSKFDKTPNQYVYIKYNKFYNLDRAVGTHKYSEGKYHDKIYIQYNQIEKTRKDAIGMMNWSNAVIENNTITNVNGGTGRYRAIAGWGVINPIIQNNTFNKVSRPMQFSPWKNTGDESSKYAITYNQLSNENKEMFKNNKITNVEEDFIRINNLYNIYDRETERIQMEKS